MNALPPSAEHDADDSAFRAALRREKLAARLAVGPAEHAALSARVAAHLAGLWSAMAKQTLAFCAPVRGEFDARPLVGELLARGWRAAMPVVVMLGRTPTAGRIRTSPCGSSRSARSAPIS